MAQAADPLQIRLLDDEPRSSASESTLHVRKDRLAVLVLLNLTLGIIATVIAYQYIDEAKLFTFEWTERLHPADDRLNMTGFAKELDMMYNTSRNFSVENLGTIMGFILKRARCQPVMLDASLRWGQEGVSPLCNCLRNYHVAYVKAVKPHGPYVTPEKLQEMSHNITLIRDAVQGKCFNSLRPTQVEGVRGDVMSTNIVSTVLYWNAIGFLVSLFIFLFDGVLPVMMQNTEGGKTTSILWWSRINEIALWTMAGLGMLLLLGPLIAATQIHHLPDSWGTPNPVNALCYWVLPIALGTMLMLVVNSQKANPEVYVQTGDQQIDPYPIRKSLVYWTGYAMATPFVANAMYMLLQRRDWLLNEAVFLSVLAAALCPLAIEMMQRFFAYMMSQEMGTDAGQDIYEYARLNRGKNMMIKIVMLTTAVVVLMLSLTTLPVFPSTGFSNAYYTVLVASGILALPLISPARHLTHLEPSHLRMPGAKMNVGPRMWDMYPMDPVTLEMIARFMFTLAVMGDLWGTASMDFVRSF